MLLAYTFVHVPFAATQLICFVARGRRPIRIKQWRIDEVIFNTTVHNIIEKKYQKKHLNQRGTKYTL